MDFRQALPEGSVLAGDYRIVGVLGQGGFGLTYKAEDVRLGHPVAIKEYFPSDIAVRDSGYTVHSRSSQEQGVFGWGREKFLEEARTLARFRHPGIVRVARLFEANNTAYMVLDFEAGPNLSQWRRTLGRAPTQAEIDHIAKALLGAVEAVHAAGILHRDIKPANVIMRDGNTPILIDFGAARQALGARSKTVHAIVTPGYSPKEQYALDVDRQGAWSDIYALGATLFFLVTGAQPADALSRDLEASSPIHSDGTELYRRSFLDAVDAAMQVRSEDRPQSIAEWRPMLLSGAPTPRTRALTELAGTKRPEPPRATAGFGGAPSGHDKAKSGKASAADLAPQPAAKPASRFPVLAAVLSLFAITAALGAYQFTAKPKPAEVAPPKSAASPVASVGAPVAPLASPPTSPTLPQTQPQPPPAATPSTDAASSNPTQKALETPPPASPQPAAQAPVADRLPVRQSLPGPIPDSELERLKQEATAQEWRLARGVFSQEGFRGFSDQVRDFSVELARLTGGKFKINILPPEEAPRGNEVLYEVATKSGMLGWHAPFQSNNRGFVYSIFSGGIPFGLSMADHVRWMRAEGTHLLEQAYWRDRFIVRAIPCGIASGLGGWFQKDLRDPSDLRGFKFRSMNLLLDQVFRKVGAEVVKVDISNAVTAMSDRTIDGFYTLTPTARGYLGQNPIAPFFLTNDWYQPAYLFDLVIGADAWLALGLVERRLVFEVCRRNVEKALADFAGIEAEVLNRIRNNKGVTVKPLAPAVVEALRTAARAAIAEEAARDPVFKEVLGSYNRFQSAR